MIIMVRIIKDNSLKYLIGQQISTLSISLYNWNYTYISLYNILCYALFCYIYYIFFCIDTLVESISIWTLTFLQPRFDISIYGSHLTIVLFHSSHQCSSGRGWNLGRYVLLQASIPKCRSTNFFISVCKCQIAVIVCWFGLWNNVHSSQSHNFCIKLTVYCFHPQVLTLYWEMSWVSHCLKTERKFLSDRQQVFYFSRKVVFHR